MPEIHDTTPKRLYRSLTDRWIAGVCGGLAEYLHLDSVLVRIGMLVILVASKFTALILYLVMWVIVPPEPPGYSSSPEAVQRARNKQRRLAGAVLLLIGALLLGVKLDFFTSDIWSWTWPAGLLLIGVILLVRPQANKPEAIPSAEETTTYADQGESKEQ